MNKKEKMMKVIEDLKNLSQETQSAGTVKQASAEETFNANLLQSFGQNAPESETPEAIGKRIAASVIKELEANVNNEPEKTAGVVGAPAVMSEPGVHAPDPGDPTLGKTVTTTNEVEKGLVAKDKTAIVNGIIQKLLANHGVGPSTIVNESAQQVMVTPGIKAAELDKEAAEKQAAAQKVVNTLFEKYASVKTEAEKTEAVEAIVKYASAAEDVLETELGENNYNDEDITKVASAMIEADAAVYETQLAKQAEHVRAGEIMAESFVNKLNELGQTEVQKQAEAETLIKQATDLLEAEAPGKYTDEDVIAVAEALLAKASKETANPAQAVISKLSAQ